jgi:hypothetical protein
MAVKLQVLRRCGLTEYQVFRVQVEHDRIPQCRSLSRRPVLLKPWRQSKRLCILQYLYIDINRVYYPYIDIGGNNISGSFVLVPRGACEGASQYMASKSDTEFKCLENKLTALEEHLREFEDIYSARNAHFADLLRSLGETNKRRIKDLENSKNRIRAALVVLGILFTSSLVLISFRSYFTILIGNGVTQGVTQGLYILSQYVRY